MSQIESPGVVADPVTEPPALPSPGEATPRIGRETLLRLGAAWALVLLGLGVALFFSVLPETRDTFPTSANVQAVIGNQAVIAIVALAALVPLVCGEFDLSVGATLGLASVMAATVMADGAPIPLALLVAVAIGVGVGTVNGILVTKARVHAVIATFGMATIVSGLVTWKTGGQAIVDGIPTALTDFGSGNTFGVPRPLLALLAVAAVAYFVLGHTPFGRYLYALGSNRNAAQLVGLNTDRLLLLSFVVAGALAGAAGLLQVARAGTADPQIGETFTLAGLAAAFLSAAAVRPGRFNVGGVLVAIFFLATLNSGLNLAGAEAFVSDFVNGGALIVGVALAGFLGRRLST